MFPNAIFYFSSNNVAFFCLFPLSSLLSGDTCQDKQMLNHSNFCPLFLQEFLFIPFFYRRMHCSILHVIYYIFIVSRFVFPSVIHSYHIRVLLCTWHHSKIHKKKINKIDLLFILPLIGAYKTFSFGNCLHFIV